MEAAECHAAREGPRLGLGDGRYSDYGVQREYKSWCACTQLTEPPNQVTMVMFGLVIAVNVDKDPGSNLAPIVPEPQRL